MERRRRHSKNRGRGRGRLKRKKAEEGEIGVQGRQRGEKVLEEGKEEEAEGGEE